MKNGLIVNESGTKFWYVSDLYHKEDGPAAEYKNGNKLWYQHGKLHRNNGPAVELFNGDKEWYQNGELHREDGPAVDYWEGHKEWWYKGIKYSKEEFNILINGINLNIELPNNNNKIKKHKI